MFGIPQLIAAIAFGYALIVLFVVFGYWSSQVAEGLVECSVRLYRLLLAAYPAPFRREFGEAMVQLFRDTARDAYGRSGFLGVAAMWPPTLTDLTISVIRQHRDKPVTVSSESVLLCDFLQKWRRLGSDALSVAAFSTWYGLHLLRLYFRRAVLVWTTLTTIAFGIWFASFFNSITLIRNHAAWVAIGGGCVQIQRHHETGKPISDERHLSDLRAWMERNPYLTERLNGPARPWEFSFVSEVPGGRVLQWRTTAPDRLGMVRHEPVLVQPYKSWQLRFPFGFLPAFLLVWTIRVFLRRNTGSVAAMQSV